MSPAEAAHDLGRMIISVRETKVILDSDLAVLYGVETKTLNRAVKRNLNRLPESFMFRLEPQELTNLRYQIGTSSSYGGRRYLPYAFTEELASTQVLARKLAEIERTVITHDAALKQLFQVIKPLLAPPPDPPRKKIGFHP
ncbi:MAG TPA: ORF6N domain-containing protein [Candidatus Methylacidiphilales bacterium]|jgi:hypothetical protein|nr:ORF6N domain-containing protein [Candidatus Methylacidiphilales bacterium]